MDELLGAANIKGGPGNDITFSARIRSSRSVWGKPH